MTELSIIPQPTALLPLTSPISGAPNGTSSTASANTNPTREAQVIALNAAPTKEPNILFQTWGELLKYGNLNKADQEKYSQQVVNLFMNNFPEGTYNEKFIKQLLNISIRGSDAMSPTYIALDEANETVAGVMLPSRPLSARWKLNASHDRREEEIYRLIDAGIFPFKAPDSKDTNEIHTSIYIPAGICRNPDERYKGKSIPEKLFKLAVISLKDGIYKGKARYMVTGHDLNNPASTKMHDNVGCSQEYLTDARFKYSHHNDGKIDKNIRLITLC